MKKIKVKFKDLYKIYANNKKDNQICDTKKNIYVKTPEGSLTKIRGLIKKTSQKMVYIKLHNGIEHKMADGHLLKTVSGFKKVKDLNINDLILVYNSSPSPIVEILEYSSDEAYDISIDHPHEYITPNNLVHHNTTIALILASPNGVLKNPDDNLLEINGSAQSNRGIGFVDNVIVPFLKLPPFGKDSQKIVFIDEADYLTDASFHALRHPTERFSKTNSFILTCNYVSKLPEALQSRFQFYEFKRMSIEYVTNHCKKMLESENVEFDDKSLNYVITNLYPDIRRIINALQRCSVTGKLKVNKDVVLTTEKLIIASTIEIISCIKNKENNKIGPKVNEILKLINEKDIEYRSLYSTLFYTKEIPPPAKIIINRYTNEHGSCLVPSMHFMAMVFDIINCLNAYGK